MAREIKFPRGLIKAGRQEFVSAMPQSGLGIKYAGARIARNNWPDTGSDVVRVTVEVSEDQGATWGLMISFTASGGEARDRTGAVQTHSGCLIGRKDRDGNDLPLFPERNGLRRIRLVVEPLIDLDTEIEQELT